MSDIVIRKATKQRIPELSRQMCYSFRAAYKGVMDEEHLTTLDDDYWEGVLSRALDEGSSCLLAKYKRRIVGSAVYGKPRIDAQPGEAELYSIYLLPEYTGHGTGRILYQAVEADLLEQGYTGCVLEVLSQNDGAIRFYNSLGFEQQRLYYVQEGERQLECMLMGKSL